jgi:phage tail sheath protein FI
VPVTATYPGVYIEEIPSGVHPITGVATSIAAFVDFFARGPMNEATEIFSFGDFQRVFGGLDDRSEASYAIQQFFLNGGTQAVVVRVASSAATKLSAAAAVNDTTLTVGANGNSDFPNAGVLTVGTGVGVEQIPYTGKTASTFTGLTVTKAHAANDPVTIPPAAAASVVLEDAVASGNPVLTVTAANEGAWGNALRAFVDYTGVAAGHFNLTISEVAVQSGRLAVVRQEQYLDLTTTPGQRFVESIVNGASELISVAAAGSNPPTANGTVSGAISASFPLTAPLQTSAAFTPNADGTGTSVTATLDLGGAEVGSIDEAAARLEAAIRAATPTDPAWAGATVRVVGNTLQIAAGPSAPGGIFKFSAVTGSPLTASLELRTGTTDKPSENVALYQLGAPLAGAAQATPVAGSDGLPPNATDLVGTNAVDPPTGIYALDKADLFNILCIPRVAQLDGNAPFASNQVTPAISQAISYCDAKRAFLVLDTPSDVTNVLQMKQFLTATLNGLRDRNVAFYFPRTTIADPLDGFRARSIGASGTVAGIYARIDASRGVWKAPAGTEASLQGVQQLDYKMTDAENGVLNPLGINCLRTFDVYGNICWGARTLDGADQQASEWKYIPVRRFALFLEETLFRNTKWVVFEPNDEPLWAQIRLNVGAFMHNLFRQGAFQGTTPKEAYLVKCDKETTNQTDIDNGVVNILVGFAPLKPAEFVIIQIQQRAGQIET